MAKKRVPSKKKSKPRAAISHYNQPARDNAEQSVFNEFARRLQAAMIERGWNQSALAREASARLPGGGIGRDAISHYIRGVSMPRPERLAAIAQALGRKDKDLLPPGVPSIGRDTALFSWKSMGGGRVEMHLNRTVSFSTAMKISELMKSEDAHD